MKSKFVKTALLAAGIVIAAGGVCLGAGLAMGGSPSFYYDSEGIHVKEESGSAGRADYELSDTEIDAVKNLEIELVDADLEIVSGKEWAVEYVLDGQRSEPEFSVENQTLTIREGQNSKMKNGYTTFGIGHSWWYDNEEAWKSPYVKITVPDAARLETVSIVSRYGSVTVGKKLYAQTTGIQAENGEVKLDGWEGGDLSFEMLYGTLVTGKLEGKNLTVKNQDGSVKMESLLVETADFSLGYGDLSATLDGTGSVEVESESGEVSLSLVGGMDRYGVSLHTDWGTIRTPQGIAEADECNGNSDFIRMEQDTAGVRVYTQDGDIRIRDAA
ncbi:MAG: DUF4097 family beta strand repeat-containing protein [Eubacteriales bacterium]|nr:DUF4097 family beta strand repeat-containing protein [Eubacteriales bacterium]